MITVANEITTILAEPATILTVLTVGQGPSGAPGATSGDKHYRHTQGAASTVWSIAHGLNKYPTVTTFDSTADQVEGVVSYADLNTVTITFSGAVSGEAYLN